MARNKVQFQKGLSEAEFDKLYGTEERCHAELARLRWPDGFECPDCGGQAHCVVKRGARQLFQCNACRKQTSVKAGTIFASSKLPLRLWFKTMYLMTQSKKGISSIELGRRLGVTQTTAWAMKHKFAQVMIERNGAKRLNGNTAFAFPIFSRRRRYAKEDCALSADTIDALWSRLRSAATRVSSATPCALIPRRLDEPKSRLPAMF